MQCSALFMDRLIKLPLIPCMYKMCLIKSVKSYLPDKQFRWWPCDDMTDSTKLLKNWINLSGLLNFSTLWNSPIIHNILSMSIYPKCTVQYSGSVSSVCDKALNSTLLYNRESGRGKAPALWRRHRTIRGQLTPASTGLRSGLLIPASSLKPDIMVVIRIWKHHRV